ncbi:MAG: MMPL family transporter [Chloroflexi bacterium]|nr:MMPL family transporter [Chloroflexota bacterium]
MLQSLTHFCYHRRGAVLIAWVILIIGLFVLKGVAGGAYRTEFSLPGSETDAADKILKDHGFNARTGQTAQVVFQARQGVDDPAVRRAMETFFANVQEKVPGASISSPYTPEGARQVSKDGTIAYGEVNLPRDTEEGYISIGDDIKAERDKVKVDGLRLELGGDMFAAQTMPASELIGIAAAIVILVVAFGSLLAMGLPIATALLGVGAGTALVGLTARFISVPVFTTPTAAMLGIGVGIDYALLIVTRYRQGLHDGLEPEDAVQLSMNTAGRAVLFAGVTVVIAVLGMYFMNLALIRAVATGAALAVLMTMLASITLLPALLAFAGRRIDRFGLPHKKTAETAADLTFWRRWSQVIQRYPWPALVGAAVVLLVLASPVLSLRLGFADAGNRPTADTTRQAYDLLSRGFGPGFNGPLIVAAETPTQADIAAVQRLSETLGKTEGVAAATPPQPSGDGKAALIIVFPTTAPQDKQTSQLVDRLREQVIPQALRGSTALAKVGGITAGGKDFASYTGEKMPIFFAAVLALSFLLLMVVFRSLLVPLKAVVMNMLSIGAAFGLMIVVFQWGWGQGLIGVGREGPIEAWVPMMLFAIVFGLSMDYEVFLLSRIREEYDRNGNDNAKAVADGLAATARVITAAAAIMVSVFASFVLGDDRALKLFGFGLAAAVFIDATIVRLVLVPATMELLGRANWWLPQWLEKRLPEVHVEGKIPVAGRPAPEPSGGQ